MGYPLTFKRFVNRNHLADGDYGTPMSHLSIGDDGVSTLLDSTAEDFNDGVDFTKVLKDFISTLFGEIEYLNRRWGTLLGDLRRLERDAVDEGAICQQIAERTGIDGDVVAAVLKEFVSI